MNKTTFIINFLVCILCLNITAKSQSAYGDTCQYARSFDGEWINITGNDTLKVYFRTQNLYEQVANKYKTTVFGWHEYKKGSTVIQSDYSHRFDNLPILFDDKHTVNFSINLAFLDCVTPLVNLYGYMNDISINKGSQRWVLRKPSANTIFVTQTPSEANLTIYHTTGRTLPETFTLTRN